MTKKTLMNAKKVALAITCAATVMTTAAPLVQAAEADPAVETLFEMENTEEAESVILDENQEEDETDAVEDAETEADAEDATHQKIAYPDWWYESSEEEDNAKIKSRSCKADMDTYETVTVDNVILFPSLSGDGNQILYKDNHGVVMATRDRTTSTEEVDQYQVQEGEIYHFRIEGTRCDDKKVR